MNSFDDCQLLYHPSIQQHLQVEVTSLQIIQVAQHPHSPSYFSAETSMQKRTNRTSFLSPSLHTKSVHPYKSHYPTPKPTQPTPPSHQVCLLTAAQSHLTGSQLLHMANSISARHAGLNIRIWMGHVLWHSWCWDVCCSGSGTWRRLGL